MTEKSIPLDSMVCMDLFTEDFPLRVDVAYAGEDNLLFGEQLYKKGARLWLHEDMAKIVLLASKFAALDSDVRMILHDGLRTTDAQALMLGTQRVKDNPHWLEDPPLLSKPGAGGHPRAMAVDISLETADGKFLDMGTAFDFLAEDSGPDKNPAHRLYAHEKTILQNRKLLDQAMSRAAEALNIPLLPLPQEWWDFRLPPEIFDQYAPLSDADLPPQMRMTNTQVSNALQDFDAAHFTALKERLSASVDAHLR